MSRKGLQGHIMTCSSIKHAEKRCLLISFSVPHCNHSKEGRTWEETFFETKGFLQRFWASPDLLWHLARWYFSKKGCGFQNPNRWLAMTSPPCSSNRSLQLQPYLDFLVFIGSKFLLPSGTLWHFQNKMAIKAWRIGRMIVMAARGTSCIFSSSEGSLPVAGRTISHLPLDFLPYSTPSTQSLEGGIKLIPSRAAHVPESGERKSSHLALTMSSLSIQTQLMGLQQTSHIHNPHTTAF